MEIKLNQYTLPLFCGLVGSITYAIIRYTIEQRTQNVKEKKKKKKNFIKDDSEDDTDASETEYLIQKSRTRKDSIFLAKHKRKISEDEIECNNAPVDNENKEDELEEGTNYEEYDYDESEENNPAQMLQERIKRSKKNNSGTGGRRGTIAFADELQATLADHFKHSESCGDKSGCNGNGTLQMVIADGIDKNEKGTTSAEPASDIKPILKQQLNGIHDLEDKTSRSPRQKTLDLLRSPAGSRRSSKTGTQLLEIIMSPYASRDGSRRNSITEDLHISPLATKSGTILRSVSSTGKQIQELLKNPLCPEGNSPRASEAIPSNILISIHPPESRSNDASENEDSTETKDADVKPVNVKELERVMKEYQQCMAELRVYKGHVVALQEDLEEVEKENNTLRLITEKSEQGRRMSILITENEALFQSNCTLCNQLEDLENEVEEKEHESGVNCDMEKNRLTRQAETLYKQNTKLEKELRQLKEDHSEKFTEYLSLKVEKEKLDDKTLEMTDLLTESEEKCKNLDNEKYAMKNIIDDIKHENNCKTLQIQEHTLHKLELTSKELKLEETLIENAKLEESITLMENKIKENEMAEQSKISYMDKLTKDLNEEKEKNRNLRLDLLHASTVNSHFQSEISNGRNHNNTNVSNSYHLIESNNSDASKNNSIDDINSTK